MYGGQDEGFAFSYWRLSYRRKFIRTIWGSIVGVVFCVWLMVKEPSLNNWPMYALLGISIPLGVLQALYNYRRWQAEVCGDASSR